MKAYFIFPMLLISLLLQSCSGNAFHLRKQFELPAKHQQFQIVNLSYESDFVKVFEVALEESGGKLLEKTSTKIKFNNFREEKRVIAYTSKRKSRKYLLSLKFDYTIVLTNSLGSKNRINLDQVFIYDANFALGKAEEENQIRQNLYAEAARLILLKLKYSKK